MAALQQPVAQATEARHVTHQSAHDAWLRREIADEAESRDEVHVERVAALLVLAMFLRSLSATHSNIIFKKYFFF